MAETASASEARTGRELFAGSFLLALGGALGCALLQVALYARPAPHGGPYLAEWERYFWLALYYDLGGVWLLSLPFLLAWLVLFKRPVGERRAALALSAQALVLAANLLVSQADHEVGRFLGVRLNPTFVFAYSNPHALSDSQFLDVLGEDRGGAFVSLALLLIVPALYLVWGLRQSRRRPRSTAPLWLAVALALVPLLAPANGWRMATSQFRLRKVEPVAVAFAVDLAAGYADRERPPDFAALAQEYRANWLTRSADKGWRFTDPAHPYWREPVGAAPPAEPWNVLYIQLETFRGADMGALNPGRGPSPTPFLDAFARRPDAALWTRANSFGMPSINGVFATHCSVAPPSRRYVTALTHVEFLCLPELLRARGYRAEMFHGEDTDWDNSSRWLEQWYDRLWRFPELESRDRPVFHRAAERIRALGRSGKPFFAAVVSVTNHTPFVNPEPAFDMNEGRSAAERIRNTTRYTDDVVREFITSLEDEPWFDRTLVVITGDHGFNVGEHGQVPGQQNLYRESVWVPLIVAGKHPRLVPGAHDGPASLLDVAPTLADLLGVRVANPWQGHSLLAVDDAGGGLYFGFREAQLAETRTLTAVRDPADGAGRLYRRGDWLQRDDIAPRNPSLVRALLERAARAQRLNDYVLRNGLVVPRTSS